MRRAAIVRARRIAALVAVASLLAMPSRTRGEDRDTAADGQALLDRVRALQDLKGEGGTPFVLYAQIRAMQDKTEATGTYTLKWLARNRWHEELRLAEFTRIRDGVDGGYRQVRSVDFQPRVIDTIDQMLNIPDVTKLTPQEHPGAVTTRNDGDRELTCLEIDLESHASREICVESATGAVARAGSGAEESSYSGSIAIGTKVFPSKLIAPRTDDFTVEIDVTDLEEFHGDANSLPSPRPEAEFWGSCEDEKPPEALYRSSPIFALKQRTGVVWVYARIETDGTATHLTVLGNPSPALGREALKLVKKWKLKPAMCGNTPVLYEVLIEDTFNGSK
jgi:hypothetical protein